jgi:tRNA(His) 5'-end guanylyltransferase
MPFKGRVQKLTSVLASECSVKFNKLLPLYLPKKVDNLPVFDCRVWSVPTPEEAVNYLIWRCQDCTRNSISMAAQSQFSHKELQNKNCNEMQEMLFSQRNINWSEYPEFFKNGTIFLRRKVSTPFTAEELDNLPPKHKAHTNPDLVVDRIRTERYSILLTKITNRVSFVFDNEPPIKEQEG